MGDEPTIALELCNSAITSLQGIKSSIVYRCCLRNPNSDYIAKLIENSHIDVDWAPVGGPPILFRIIEMEREDLFILMLKYGANPNIKYNGKSLLISACESGLVKIVEILLQENIDINHKYNGQTPLIVSSSWGYHDIVKALLRISGIDINAVDNEGRTALMVACDEGHVGVAEILLVNNIDVNIQDSRSRTALTISWIHGLDSIVEQILRKENVNTDSYYTHRHNALSIEY